MKLTEHELTELRRSEGVEQSALGKTLGSRLYFKGGHRLASQLIGGSAATSIDGREEPLCAQRMELFSDGKLMAATHTDSLGNFRFDRLGEVGDEITLVLHHEGRKYQRCVKKTNGSFSVGVIYIEPPVGEIKPAAPGPQTVSI